MSARLVRGLAIILSWSVALLAVAIALTTDVPQSVVLLLFISSIVPYLASLQLLEPWLERRAEQRGPSGAPQD